MARAITPIKCHDQCSRTGDRALFVRVLPHSRERLGLHGRQHSAFALDHGGRCPVNTSTGKVGKPLGLGTAYVAAIALTPDGAALAEVGLPPRCSRAGVALRGRQDLGVGVHGDGAVRNVAELGDQPATASSEVAITPNSATAYVLTTFSSFSSPEREHPASLSVSPRAPRQANRPRPKCVELSDEP